MKVEDGGVKVEDGGLLVVPRDSDTSYQTPLRGRPR